MPLRAYVDDISGYREEAVYRRMKSLAEPASSHKIEERVEKQSFGRYNTIERLHTLLLELSSVTRFA